MLTDIIREPNYLNVVTGTGIYKLEKSGDDEYSSNGITVRLTFEGAIMSIHLTAPSESVSFLNLRWHGNLPNKCRILGDHWERADGDLEWRGIVPDRVMPWFFIVWDGKTASGYGVKTGASSFCMWRADSQGISLRIDVRSGSEGVTLGDRTLKTAEITSLGGMENEPPFQFAGRFCRKLCDSPRLPDHIVYGANDWYYAYGSSTHETILRDVDELASLTEGISNRPYMVIDAGWARHTGVWDQAAIGSDWSCGNTRFPDMPGLADKIRQRGVKPGIWIRPLAVPPGFDESLLMDQTRYLIPMAAAPTLDPSIPENLVKVEKDIRRLNEWGYSLIKHDFTTFDVLGRWSFEMGSDMTNPGWHFADRSKTSAEIILNLYKAIRRGAGDSLIIGCNTFGHLTAGLVELQRTGDDTSGLEWERTRKYGVNTLAFRMSHHEVFYLSDADCVGLTQKIPWELNRQWLDVLSKSGTPLFVSAEPAAIGTEQKSALKTAYERASKPQPFGEPLDWMDTTCPSHWRFGDETVEYNWIPESGI